MYMERILKQKFEDISLDTSSLRRLAEAIPPVANDDRPTPSSSPRDEEELVMEQEVCTIDPIEDTITRVYHFLPKKKKKKKMRDKGTKSLTPSQITLASSLIGISRCESNVRSRIEWQVQLLM
jgi:hypothetical protein